MRPCRGKYESPNSVIPTGADYRASGDLRSGGTLRFMFAPIAGGPFKPGFGLSGDVHISPTLSFRPEQITANGNLRSGGTLCWMGGN
jgi:hypothetical protein